MQTECRGLRFNNAWVPVDVYDLLLPLPVVLKFLEVI